MDRNVWLRRPIARFLLLSIALHLAFILVVQSRPRQAGPRTVVISARLMDAPPVQTQPQTPLPRPAQTQTPALAQKDLPLADAVPEPNKPAPAPVPPAQPMQASVAASLPSLPLGIDSTWYQARQVDVQPKALDRIEPAYPDEARRKGVEGTLKLRLRIDELGRVREAEVVEATPSGVFDAAALAAFGQARFQPALREGRPVRIEAYYRLDFKLEN